MHSCVHQRFLTSRLTSQHLQMSEPLETQETILYGLGESTLTINCGGITFLVHREVISQASAVWNKMLTGDFAEASAGSIKLHGDDPKALKLALDIIYSQLSGNMNCQTSNISAEDKAQLHVIIDKYQLLGVDSVIKTVESIKVTHQMHQGTLENIRIENENNIQLYRCRLMQPGMLVDYRDRPPLGTRVMENFGSINHRFSPLSGVIIANDEDNGTEIGVRWDNGKVRHHIWCGKKGGNDLKYC